MYYTYILESLSLIYIQTYIYTYTHTHIYKNIRMKTCGGSQKYKFMETKKDVNSRFLKAFSCVFK